MKRFLIALFLLLSVVAIAQVHVRGYYRSNGTYVEPHMRSSPNSSPYDNYSYPGNTNPYTGKTATGNPDTYIKNLYDNKSTPSGSDVWVDGYYRKDGTYVTGHGRSAPNGDPYDNFSFPGNTNPYTGKIATGNPETYLKKYGYGTYESNYVSTSSLRLRSGPSTNYSIVTTLSYGDMVEVIDNSNVSWTKVKAHGQVGYVYNSYLTPVQPVSSTSLEELYFKDNYPDYNTYKSSVPSYTPPSNYNNYYSNTTYPSPDYSSNTTAHPYGYNKGKVSIWTDCSDAGTISVYLDGSYIGTISSYYTSAPDCSNSTLLSVTKSAGRYKIKATGSGKSWEGYITITSDECMLEQLSK